MKSDLYFILNPSLGIIKIGIADRVDERHYSLECACGVALDVLGVLKDGSDFERRLHEAFHADRLIGEWFQPSEELYALAVEPERVPEFVANNASRIESGRRECAVELQARRRENYEIRRAEREAALILEVAAAHKVAIRENRSRDRKIAAKAASEEKRRIAEITTEAEHLARSARVGDRLMARELVAAAADRRTDIARLSAQRLRNAAFNGVKHAAVR